MEHGQQRHTYRATDWNFAVDRSVLDQALRWCSPKGRGNRLKIGPVGVRIPPPAPARRLCLPSLYLGDGYINRTPRTYVLRLFLNDRQPCVVAEAARIIAHLVPRRVGLNRYGHVILVRAYWGGWPAMLPQHGPGKKYQRHIWLAPWQERLVTSHPDPFVRGCIHSDGCRHRRIVRGKDYPAYSFSNRLSDILKLFAWACRLLELRPCRSNQATISIARRADVARLDAIMARSWSECPDQASRD